MNFEELLPISRQWSDRIEREQERLDEEREKLNLFKAMVQTIEKLQKENRELREACPVIINNNYADGSCYFAAGSTQNGDVN